MLCRITHSGLALCFLFSFGAACASRSGRLAEDRPWLAAGARPEPGQTRAEPTGGGPAPSRQGETLGEWIAEALEHNPSIRSSEAQYRAAVSATDVAVRLPDLQVLYTWLPLPVETRTGPNEHRIALTQVIPFPGKLVAAGAEAEAHARAARWAYHRTVRDVVIELKQRAADLHYLDRAVGLIASNAELAEALATLGAEHLQRGEGALFDVVRAQSQLAQLDYDRTSLSERAEVVRSQIRALLGRSGAAPVDLAQGIPHPELAIAEDALLRVAMEHRQELHEADARIEAADSAHDKAIADLFPDITLGAQVLVQGASPQNPAPPDSGDEAVGVAIGLSLPIWAWGHAGAIDQADAEWEAALWDKSALLNRVRVELRDALYAYRNANRLRRLYDDTLLPQAAEALQSAERWHEGDPSRYADLLEARAAYYAFSLARERALADAYRAIAGIERAVGRALGPTEAIQGAP